MDECCRGSYQGDYLPIGGSGANAFGTPYQASSGLTSGLDLFNGNIGSASYALSPFAVAGSTSGFTGYTYRYDQLNRLTRMDHQTVAPYTGTSRWTPANVSADYGQLTGYDGNGNILTSQRNGTLTGGMMDQLSYNYSRDMNGNLLNNKLGYINGQVNTNAYPNDLALQSPGNYIYNNVGSLIGDNSQSITQINWTAYGKMASISKSGVQGLGFGYDPAGNRITKTATATNGSSTTTHYVRDAQGHVLGVYAYKANSSGTLTEGDWLEQHLYGSERLGILMPHVVILAGQALANDQYNANTDQTENTGNHLYELTNHLGNVMLTVNDVLNPPGAGGNTGVSNTATVVSAQDYYPFGMEMPGRTYLASWSANPNYRYGFNGKENDNELEGVGNQIDYGARIYDPRAGRFLSVDPLAGSYPWYTPYQFAGNSPIRFVDRDGEEEANPSWFTKALNAVGGHSELNRLDDFMIKNHLSADDVVSLPNDTYVAIQTYCGSQGIHHVYSVFRRVKADGYIEIGFGRGAGEDDVGLSEEQFAHTKVVGAHVMDAPMFGGGAISEVGTVLNGAKNNLYVWREVITTVQAGMKELQAWKNYIKFGVLDAMGQSKDLLTKGFHLHFLQLDGLELSLQYVPKVGAEVEEGEVALGYLTGKQNLIKDAIKTFNAALANDQFKQQLIVKLKAAQETLTSASRVLYNEREATMAAEKATEIGKILKVLEK